MKPLAPADTKRLVAAYQLLGSGRAAAARAELEAISPGHDEHPGVLTARLAVCESERDWPACVQLAEVLIRIQPNNPIFVVQRSVFLRDQGRIQEALDGLAPAAEKFPTFWMIPYQLAGFACRLGNLAAARNHLNAAAQLVDADALKAKALAERDLEPLWTEIRNW